MNITEPNLRIVFVQDKFFLGGIEVLELKLIKELSRRGYDVAVVSRENEALDESSIAFSHFTHNGYPDFISRSSDLITNVKRKVIFVSLHPTAAMAAEIAGRRIVKTHGYAISVHHFHWVSHSRAFFFSQWRFIQRLFESFFTILPLKSTYFMNDAAARAHKSFWRKSLEEYPIIRIVGRKPRAISSAKKEVVGSSGDKIKFDLRIVSVGRLVPFKSYNINAPKVMRLLLDSGVNATWDIWGYGPEESAIIAESRKYDVAQQVRLQGALPHARFDQVVSSYDVFVGMGTSVLEAANAGMPSCVSLESQGDACYGFLHEAPIDSVGDLVAGFPERKLHKVLRAFSKIDPEGRAKIGEADALAARQRESTLDDFVAAILSAEQIKQIGRRERVILAFSRAYLAIKHWKLERSKN